MSSTIHIPETNSTNEHLNALLKSEKLDEGSILWADFQTAGKGQIGNSWESEQGKNLTFSMVLYPNFIEANQQFILSKLVSVAITEVLSDEIYEPVHIKWPNDIYVGNKKIAGILIDNVLTGKYLSQTIIGIGINVNQEKFFSNAPNPISLKQITAKEFHLNELLKKIKEKIILYYIKACNYDETEINEKYLEHLFWKDGYHTFEDDNEIFEARIKNIKSTGHLILEKKDDIEKAYAFKEVKFML